MIRYLSIKQDTITLKSVVIGVVECIYDYTTHNTD